MIFLASQLTNLKLKNLISGPLKLNGTFGSLIHNVIYETHKSNEKGQNHLLPQIQTYL